MQFVRKIVQWLLVIPRLVFGKYRVLIMAVSLFVMLDAGVLVLNFYTSYKIAQDAHAIEVTSQQTVLSQSILHRLYQIEEDLVAGKPNYQTSVDGMADSFKTLDETIDSMIYGGTMIGSGQNKDNLFTQKEYAEANRLALENIQAQWSGYRTRIMPVAHSYFSGITQEELLEKTRQAISYGRAHNDELMGLFNVITKNTEKLAEYKAQQLRYVQVAGISLAFVNFFLILFHFIRKLNNSDRLVERAQQETQEILSSVTEGLFLMDQQGVIGSQFSHSLCRLMNREQFENEVFMDLLAPSVSEKTLLMVNDYVEVLFSTDVDAALIERLNPLNEVKTVFDNRDGTLTTRYLAFRFSRSNQAGQRQHLLVMVSDVTDAVNLRNELATSEEKSSREIEVMLSILHVDRIVMQQFIDNTRQGLQVINTILSNPEKTHVQLVSKITKIARIAHHIKGECGAIGLKHYEQKLHEFEDSLVLVSDKEKINGNDFVAITVSLNGLMADWATLESIVTRLKSLAEMPEADFIRMPETRVSKAAEDDEPVERKSHEKKHWETLVYRLAQDASAHFNKTVTVDMRDFCPEVLTDNIREPIKTFVIQCVRNAIAHGIEPPGVRRNKGKPEMGMISIYAFEKEGYLYAGVRDDGAGLNINAIRRRAVEKSLWTEFEARRADKSALIAVMFSSGFSTANNLSQHAGRGVGLDLVKSMIDEVGGLIDIGTHANEFAEFRVKVPLSRGVICTDFAVA